MRSLAGALAAVCLLAGCGTSGDRTAVRGVVERFYTALREDRGAEACALLGGAAREQLESQAGQPCASAVARLDFAGGTIEEAHVYAVSAKVDLRGGESAFLSREPAGWTLSAVACRATEGPAAEVPMDCELRA